MSSQSQTAPATTELRLPSPNGPVTRTILRTPLRDALPSEIPIINVEGIFSNSLEDRQAVAFQIRDAATNTGFFYITNHGIDAGLTDALHGVSLDFFRQDLEVKMRASSKHSKHGVGYRPPNTQKINPDEGIDVMEHFFWRYDPSFDPSVQDPASIPEQAKAMLACDDYPLSQTSNLPHFEKALISHHNACIALARRLARTFALSLYLPEDIFDGKMEYPGCSLGINYYPPIDQPEEPADPSARVSIGSHTDFELFTILWQDDVGGLQVLNRDGQWIRAVPVRGSLVVNISDFMQRITNDKYVSTVHRAQNWSGKERVSIPFFFGFGLHESCGVLPSCIAEGEEPKYPEINCHAWIQKRLSDMFELDKESIY
ncbi:hypothetical protein NLG97_g6291 [Lecanicillium saksenae]|uniref:Uncharacterized protein n=1 Tax=Lecanicillium saksenae TaxID=468837 RepID=A0ACC1QRX7_9HYPO|nr:hypothetical protein NLG97_g6291 [Lecanicillium saksenae]